MKVNSLAKPRNAKAHNPLRHPAPNPPKPQTHTHYHRHILNPSHRPSNKNHWAVSKRTNLQAKSEAAKIPNKTLCEVLLFAKPEKAEAFAAFVGELDTKQQQPVSSLAKYGNTKCSNLPIQILTAGIILGLITGARSESIMDMAFPNGYIHRITVDEQAITVYSYLDIDIDRAVYQASVHCKDFGATITDSDPEHPRSHYETPSVSMNKSMEMPHAHLQFLEEGATKGDKSKRIPPTLKHLNCVKNAIKEKGLLSSIDRPVNIRKET